LERGLAGVQHGSQADSRVENRRITMSDVQADTSPAAAVSDARLRQIEQFLFEEAQVLDEWRLHEWLELFTADGHYLVPATDRPDGDPSRDLFLVQDDRFLLEQRVNSLLTRAAHAEYPHSRTMRMISNVRAVYRDGGRIAVTANFAVYRVRNGVLDTYVGQYRHLLEADADSLRFVERKSVLTLDALRPHGKVSIIL
jgi:p-cumate 2,3-dioxygenase beta subunit